MCCVLDMEDWKELRTRVLHYSQEADCQWHYHSSSRQHSGSDRNNSLLKRKGHNSRGANAMMSL